MWKFDLAAVGPGLAGYVTTRLFTAVDSFGNRQPISAAPRIAPHPLGGRYVVFGTGKFYDRNDKADSSVQAVYALWEKDPSSPVALAKAQLRQLTLTQPAILPPPGTPFFRTLNGQSAINWQTDLGWYFDLRAGGPGTGERVITTPIENLGFINLVSFEPLAGGDPCRGGGQSFFYRLDIASTFSRGAFDGQPNSNIAVNMDPTFGQFQIVQKKPLEYAGSQPGLGGTDLGGLRTNPPGAGAPVSACPPGVLPHITNRPGMTPLATCVIPPLRTWREMPRSPDRNAN
jgi:Tfp pilus tip-associated adhesin PilY1